MMYSLVLNLLISAERRRLLLMHRLSHSLLLRVVLGTNEPERWVVYWSSSCTETKLGSLLVQLIVLECRPLISHLPWAFPGHQCWCKCCGSICWWPPTTEVHGALQLESHDRNQQLLHFWWWQNPARWTVMVKDATSCNLHYANCPCSSL